MEERPQIDRGPPRAAQPVAPNINPLPVPPPLPGLPPPVLRPDVVRAAPPAAAQHHLRAVPPPAQLGPAAVPAVMPVPNDPQDDGENSDDERAPPAQRDRRVQTLWIFVENRPNTHYVTCKCGCVDDTTGDRLQYSAPNSGIVKRHALARHPDLLMEYTNCKNANGNFNALFEKIERINADRLDRIAKKRRRSDTFFNNAVAGLENRLKSSLTLLMWATANGVPRNALNCPLFDTYHEQIGAPAPPNRHTLQSTYLPQLDSFVVDEIKRILSNCLSVGLSADGWRDRTRRDWIGVHIYAIIDTFENNQLMWKLIVVAPDLIFMESNATAENIATSVSQSVDLFVHSFSLCTQISCWVLIIFKIDSRVLRENLDDD